MFDQCILICNTKNQYAKSTSGLKELYRLLKHTYTTDANEIVRLHSQLALEELETIMKSYLFPEETLQKSLKITL